MGYIVIDTETSGLPDYKLPADDPAQPHLAHLAMIYLDDDGEETGRDDFYIKPDGWTMEAEASAVNGLTDEFLAANGESIVSVLQHYSRLILAGNSVVAFNAQFDCKVMRGELRRAFMDDLFERTKNICVMRPMVKLCGLKQEGSNRAKWPKLGEALAYFGHGQTDAHQAIADAEGAAILFRELRKAGLLPEASVHYAKEKPARKDKPAAPEMAESF